MSTTPEFERREGERVRKLLRSLKQFRAPWYFEAKLQQRLPGRGRTRPRLFPGTVPAYALSIAAFVALGSLAYYTLQRGENPETGTHVIGDEPPHGTQGVQQHDEFPAANPANTEPVRPDEPSPVQFGFGRGPSGEQIESVRETGVLQGVRKSLQPEVLLPALNPATSMADTLQLDTTAIDSLDTHRARPDSAQDSLHRRYLQGFHH